MNVIDLCSGMGGWSKCWKDSGHNVVTVDIIQPAMILTDVRHLHFGVGAFDVVIASPPCTEFSRESMPWGKTGNIPDMSIVEACRRIIDEIQPRWHCLENVRGAVKFLGRPHARYGSRYLWGNIPPLDCPDGPDLYGKYLQWPSEDRERQRILIPPRLANALMRAILNEER